ncbi:HlyD family efflux transporter periplasmic adaptor subunit [Candidatus Microgenomates bacterium]|nr:HlyD family efflux transporter periplasmic adaptor subunit [Candidatus Microgenomates bacterium]
MKKLPTFARSIHQTVATKTKIYRKKSSSFIARRPFAAFLITLGILFVLILIGNILRKPPAQPAQKAPEPKKIEAFRVGDSPRVTVQGTVEKTGVITIVAQTPGIVQNVYASEGQRVGDGQTVAWLSSNYQGSNPASVSREIAGRNAQFSNESYDAQKDAVSKQRDIAQKQYDQAAKLREITRQSLGDTGNLIAFNQSVLDQINTQLDQAKAGGADAATILGIEQQKSAAQAQLNQLSQAYKQSDYASRDDQAPKELTDYQKELTYRQLEIQDKSVDLQRDIANLNLKMARVAELTFYPASPCPGVVERVYVSVGDAVSPGDKIATIRADRSETVVTALVDQTVAARYARAESARALFSDGTSADITADYVPQEATDGTLSAIRFTLDPQYDTRVTNKGYVSLALPLGQSASIGEDVYVPLDAVYQTQDSSYIFVARDAGHRKYTARTQEVTLGEVSGSFVRVKKGAAASDIIIISRFVQDGDSVTF